MRRILAALLLGVLLLPSPAAAGHVVSPEAARVAVAAASEQRQADIRAVEGLLSCPAAARLARSLGAEDLRPALSRLDDAELRDLARRAAALEQDPVAGFDRETENLLKIFLVIAIVILVLQAVD